MLCSFLGNLGAHRFYTGHTAIGLLYLFTLGLFTIGGLYDWVMLLLGRYKDANGNIVGLKEIPETAV